MTRTLYRIRDWEKHFEVSQTKKVHGPLNWVATPTKHDGKGFRRILQQRNGAAMYGAWCLLLQVAAKCPVRGILADDDGPLTPEDLESKTGCPEKTFAETLELLSSDRVRWIIADSHSTAVECNGIDSTAMELSGPTGQYRTVQDKTLLPTEACGEASQGECSPPAFVTDASAIVFPCVGAGSKEWQLTAEKLSQYRDTFPGVDVLAECRKARQWCIDNPTKRKTPHGMPAFLSRWLGKVQDNGGSNSGIVGRHSAGSGSPPKGREAERIERNLGAIGEFLATADSGPMFGPAIREGNGGTNRTQAHLRLDGPADTGVARESGQLPG